MAFSVCSWNVEFFGSKRRGGSAAQVETRINDVFDLLGSSGIKSDVFAIYEVNGGQVFERVKTALPEYSWQITEGPGAQQVLVGFRIPAFVTQRVEFSRGFTGPLRPGVLVTVTHEGQDYPMLFLHLKAADAAIDFGVRAHQHDKARSLRKALDEGAAAERANFIIAGDLNNVGMDLSFSGRDISVGDEIERIRAMYESRFDDLVLLGKTADATFWNGPGSSDPPADIDHVLAASRVNLVPLAGGKAVAVKGWPEEPTDAAKGAWIKKFSDHALLRFSVQGAGS
jgi:hypothetical protein